MLFKINNFNRQISALIRIIVYNQSATLSARVTLEYKSSNLAADKLIEGIPSNWHISFG